jgi:uncharacterized protein (DUF983 family)
MMNVPPARRGEDVRAVAIGTGTKLFVAAVLAQRPEQNPPGGLLARRPTLAHIPILMADAKSLWTGLKRGLARRCPNCGKGRLLRGYLTIRSPCEVCGNDNSVYPSDDFPPYLTVFVTGHVIVALFIWTDNVYEPRLWVEFVIWLPVTVLMCIALLPFMKGAAVGLCWAMNIVRQESAT